MKLPEERLLSQVSEWLADSRRLRLRFAPALEERFESDSAQSRGRGFAWAFAITALLLIGWDATALFSGMQAQPRLIHALAVLPALALAAILCARGLPAAVREAMGFGLNAGTALSLCVLYVGGWWPDTAVFAVAMTAMLLFSTTVMALRFRWALVSCAVIYLVFAGGLFASGHASELLRRNLLLTDLLLISALLLANWRHERDQRQAYVRALRDRLSRLILSQRYRMLEDLSQRDPLTGLANRRAHDEWLQKAWSRATEEQSPIGLIMVDVDHFKAYNDCYGHPAGDACLQAVGRCLRETLRNGTDYVARLGGEEFIAVLHNANAEKSKEIGERLRQAVANLNLPHARGEIGRLSVSVGVACDVPQAGRDPAYLLGTVDAALYRAKVLGRDRVVMEEGEKVAPSAAPPAGQRPLRRARAGAPQFLASV